MMLLERMVAFLSLEESFMKKQCLFKRVSMRVNASLLVEAYYKERCFSLNTESHSI